jgi:site-specific DNA-methyltransferase (adenine-specific)
MAITQLTALTTRRSVYCSKRANGKHSIATIFNDEEGSIWFKRTEHTWTVGAQKVITVDENGKEIEKKLGGKCKHCGASQSEYERDKTLESHAYALIHTEDPKQLIKEVFGEEMQFDVIIGNPPYQLSTAGHGVQARPLYHQFVEQAKKLEPRLLCMVIPARWYSGGMGLDAFRASMLGDSRLRVIQDYADSNSVFPGTQIKGGVCFFLWDREKPGLAEVTNHLDGATPVTVSRPLLEPGADVFIRYNQAVSIIKKVMALENSSPSGEMSLELPSSKSFSNLVSSIGAFGLDSTFKGTPTKQASSLKVYRNGGIGYIDREKVTKETHVIDKWKVFIPRAGSGSDSFPHSILGKPFVGEPKSISSWTYMYIGPFDSKEEAENVISYIRTKLFRFLVLLHKPSQDATKAVYTFVPRQDFTKAWSDHELYKKYGISGVEQSFIDSMIRPMEDIDA